MKFFQEEIETMPRRRLRVLQNERLARQVAHMYAHIPHYRQKR